MKDDTGEIFTLDEVAAYLKVGKRTVYRLASASKIPAFKVGGTWRFLRADIDAWIKQQSIAVFDTGCEKDGAARGQSKDGVRKG
ncbi:MAG TPA: DNA-binding protein [Halothiobacillus sp.]|nr:DNA-binding protein [Halothiobacillus sp.]